jgi:uncharacterized membrane protein
MIRHYFKIVLRNLWRNKTYSFINIVGLALGLTCFLLIALYVFDELTYDRFHKKAGRIYRVIDEKTSPEGKESKIAAVAYKIADRAPADNWLSDFAYRTKIYWWVFVIAGALALLVALSTVGLKALTAALTNPVKSLRSE